MKILISLIFTICFSLTIWADMPVYDEKKGEWVQSEPIGKWIDNPEQKKPDPKGTCMSGILLSIGIFLLGQRLIRKNAFSSQLNSPKYSA